ncbi:MAG: GDP-L-fucose synthase [Patescibacteria group bacterium]
MKMELKNKKILVTGGGGFLGRYVLKVLEDEGAKNIFAPSSKDLDLRVRENCEKAVRGIDIIFHLAAQIGGIGFIDEFAGEVIYNNAIMGMELMKAAKTAKVEKMIVMGSVCEYPKFAPLPLKEKNLWDGRLDDITGFYGMGKKILLMQGQAYRKQYDFNSIHLLPVNLYGPGDHFNKTTAHVMSALITKFVEGCDKNLKEVTVWGTGRATREFLFVEDAAKGIVTLAKNYDSTEPINLGSGVETPIRELVEMIRSLSGYEGKVKWDHSKPDGHPRRFMDISKAAKYGFRAKTDLADGIKKTIDWYEKNKHE